MFQAAYLITSFIIGVGIFEEVVVPTVDKVNTKYVQPSVDYTKQKVTEGVDYVKEKTQ